MEAAKHELEILEFWKKDDIQRRAFDMRKGGEKFYFCDGPPYATGEIHSGHVWNKSLKDAMCRFKLMQGFNVYVRAGYDTHGLPIELKVEREMGIKDKRDIEKIGVDKFIIQCRAFAEKYIDIISKQFERFAVWQDFADPYVTYKDEYIDQCWATIKKAHEKKLLVNDYYVVPYCPRCQTPLANYELEYEDMDDPSLYVKFKVVGKENEYLLIWTTTPWTLIGNVAVMAHPMLKYVKVAVDDEVWILAKDCWERVQKETGANGTILEEMSGKDLTKLKYIHLFANEVPVQNYEHSVVMSDEYVSSEEGTGLVHCAPGHGPEDYIIGKRYDLPIFSPVGPDARYSPEAGKYAGIEILKANDEILDELEDKDVLVNVAKIRHRYPKCWRCKTKLIHIASLQWFIQITKIKEKMKEENAKVNWTPKFAGVWFADFVGKARDWCISRQRYWGIPLPIWKCNSCSELRVLGSKEELGKDIELHRPYVDEVKFTCKCGGEMSRVPDVLDVWFDSGNAVWAGLRKGEEKLYPTDMIIEGKDQIRGWFYSLLGSGVVLKDEVPYKSVVMHGYVVDEKGMEMHKSLGNYVPVAEMLKRHSADAIRMWTLSNVIWEDLRFNWTGMVDSERDLSIVKNIGTYIKRFYTGKKEAVETQSEAPIEDLWFRSRLNSVTKTCTTAMNNGEIYVAVRALRQFIVEDVSRFYMKLIKKREDISTMHQAYLTTLTLAAPFVPFTAELMYRDIYASEAAQKDRESIFFTPWPKVNEGEINLLLEKNVADIREITESCNGARAEAEVGLRWPLEEVVVATTSTEIKDSVTKLSDLLKRLANVKKVVLENKIDVDIDEKMKKDLGDEAYHAAVELKKTDITKFLKGKLALGDKVLDISQYLIAKRAGYGSKIASWGVVFLKTKLDKALIAEGTASELRRRIQIMRKEMKLVEKDVITVHIAASEEFEKMIAPHLESIQKDTNTKEVVFKKGGKHTKTWEIDEEKVTVGIDAL
jgi:isoleucyl-tRNA synthetase